MGSERKKSATLRQVAEAAGVSAATASLVLNRKGEISEATRDRVMRAMNALNYVPRGTDRTRNEPRKAASLNTLRFLKISRHGQTVNENHAAFISDYIDGMSYEASMRDYTLEVASHDGESIPDILDGLKGKNLKGIICLGTELSQDDILSIMDFDLPHVIMDTHRPFLSGNFVDMDNDQLVYRALEHLKAQGFRQVGMVSSHASVTNFRLRHDAFLRCMTALELEVTPTNILSVAATLEGAHRDSLVQIDTRKLAPAFLCANDVIAFGFIRALREKGLRVPEDVSVIGIDNLPMSAMFDPPLTSLNVPKKKIGSLAVRMLDELIAAESPQPPVKVLVSGDLISRNSVTLRN